MSCVTYVSKRLYLTETLNIHCLKYNVCRAAYMHAGVLINVLLIYLLSTGSFSCSTLIHFGPDPLGGQKNIKK